MLKIFSATRGADGAITAFQCEPLPGESKPDKDSEYGRWFYGPREHGDVYVAPNMERMLAVDTDHWDGSPPTFEYSPVGWRESMLKRLQSDIHAQAAEIAKLKSDLAYVKEQKNRAETAIENLNSELAQAAENLKRRNIELENMCEDKEVLKGKLAAAISSLNEERGVVSRMNAEVVKLYKNPVADRVNANVLVEVRDILKCPAGEALTDHARDVMQSLSVAAANYEAASRENEELGKSLVEQEKFRSEVARLHSINRNLCSENAGYRQDNDRLMEEVNARQRNLDETETVLMNTRNQAADAATKWKTEIKDLRERVDFFDKNTVRLADKATRLELEVQQLQEVIAGVRSALHAPAGASICAYADSVMDDLATRQKEANELRDRRLLFISALKKLLAQWDKNARMVQEAYEHSQEGSPAASYWYGQMRGQMDDAKELKSLASAHGLLS
jgi:chromosome segregation ATPase